MSSNMPSPAWYRVTNVVRLLMSVMILNDLAESKTVDASKPPVELSQHTWRPVFLQ